MITVTDKGDYFIVYADGRAVASVAKSWNGFRTAAEVKTYIERWGY